MNIADLFSVPQFEMPQAQKEEILLRELNELTRLHADRCPAYGRILDHARGPAAREAKTIDQVPYLPVSLFKTHELRSVPDSEVKNVLTSSGTSGAPVSRIAIDAETADLQNRALASIVKTVIGPGRLPMLLADTSAVIRDPALMSARGAGVLGFMRFGRAHTFILDEQMKPDVDRIRNFLREYGGGDFLIFGFTFMVWQYLYEIARSDGFDLSKGILLHSGGWKKLQDMAVDNQTFRQRLRDATGLHRIYNFYGMVEQLGSIFLEGEDRLLHAPDFADVIVRDPVTWRPAPVGQQGVIQVVSLLPHSYPGHSLLTEDIGVIEADGAASDRRHGKGFRVIGRVPRTELRGCSDTFTATGRTAA